MAVCLISVPVCHHWRSRGLKQILIWNRIMVYTIKHVPTCSFQCLLDRNYNARSCAIHMRTNLHQIWFASLQPEAGLPLLSPARLIVQGPALARLALDRSLVQIQKQSSNSRQQTNFKILEDTSSSSVSAWTTAFNPVCANPSGTFCTSKIRPSWGSELGSPTHLQFALQPPWRNPEVIAVIAMIDRDTGLFLLF